MKYTVIAATIAGLLTGCGPEAPAELTAEQRTAIWAEAVRQENERQARETQSYQEERDAYWAAQRAVGACERQGRKDCDRLAPERSHPPLWPAFPITSAPGDIRERARELEVCVRQGRKDCY